MKVYETLCWYKNAYESTWMFMNQYVDIWKYMIVYECKCQKMSLCESVWSYVMV